MFAHSGKRSSHYSLIAVSLVLVFALSCGDDDVITPGTGGDVGSVTRTIGPGGGLISLIGVTFQIPSGSLSGDSEVTLTAEKISDLPLVFQSTGVDTMAQSAVTILSTLAMSLPASILASHGGAASLLRRSSTPGVVTVTGGFIAADPNGFAELLEGGVSQHNLTSGVSTVSGQLDLSGGVTRFAAGASSAAPVSATVVIGTFPGLSFVFDGIPIGLTVNQTFNVTTRVIATEENAWSTETAVWRDATGPSHLLYGSKIQSIPFNGLLVSRQPAVISVTSEAYVCVESCNTNCMPLRMFVEFSGSFGLPFAFWTAEVVADVECTGTGPGPY
ncbi:MAG: hypothetical protein IH969_00160 [Candidatus Krumholzibacteriota bacterium]|nr:hypothetical protein [Candidatus Krumholzibacteriota bacterium]